MEPFLCCSSSEVAKALQEKKQCLVIDPSVQVLELASYQLGDEEAMFLARVLEQNCTLTSLNLAHNNINAKGAGFIAQLLMRNTSLTSLDLQYNKIEPTAAGLIFLNSLNCNATLTSLNIGEIKGTDEQSIFLQQNIELQLNKNRRLNDCSSRAAEVHIKIQKVEGERFQLLDEFKNLQKHLVEAESKNRRLEKDLEYARAEIVKGEMVCKHLEKLLLDAANSRDEEKKNRIAADKKAEDLTEQMKHLKTGADPNKLKDGQNNNMNADLNDLAASLDNDQNEPQIPKEIDNEISRLELVKAAAQRRIERLKSHKITKLRTILLEFNIHPDEIESFTHSLNNNNTDVRKQAKKRKREEEESATDDSAVSDSDEMNNDNNSGEEPKSCSSRDTGPKVATRSTKRPKNSNEIQWKSYATIKDKDLDKKLKKIPEDVIDYFRNPESSKTWMHKETEYYKQLSIPRFKEHLPMNAQKRLQCIICKKRTAEYGNNTCPRAIMCANCAGTRVWSPTPIELSCTD